MLNIRKAAGSDKIAAKDRVLDCPPFQSLAHQTPKHQRTADMVIMTNSLTTKAPSYIALVDDDEFVLEALRRLLGAWKFDVRAYPSAQDFLSSLNDGIPGCLITDLHMPQMTGLELHDHLKNSGIEIPTIVITGQDDIELCARCQSAGVVAVLLKPVQPSSLMSAIDDARGKHNHQAR